MQTSPKPPKPGYQRAIQIGLRSVHLATMGLLLGGVAYGGTWETLRAPIIATLLSGALLLWASVAWGCLRLTEGAGALALAKLALLGLGNVFAGARLEWYLAATIVASIGSHMPATWRHFPMLPAIPSRAATRPPQ